MKWLNEVARMQQLAGINEIKINNPSIPKNQNYIDLFSKIYDEIDDADINDILIKYVPDNIWDNQDIGQIEFFEYVPDNLKRKLIHDLEKYYKENIYINEIKINNPLARKLNIQKSIYSNDDYIMYVPDESDEEISFFPIMDLINNNTLATGGENDFSTETLDNIVKILKKRKIPYDITDWNGPYTIEIPFDKKYLNIIK